VFEANIETNATIKTQESKNQKMARKIISSTPPEVISRLSLLGSKLKGIRIDRGESIRVAAKRLNVSIPTMIRLERGDPGVSCGTLFSALWFYQCLSDHLCVQGESQSKTAEDCACAD